jgi:predicted MPP superfamily phosphohydrolase
MTRAVGFVVFLLVALLLLGGIHYYLWLRLVRDTALPAPWRASATMALFLLALSGPASMLLVRQLPPGSGQVLKFTAFLWMGLMFLLLVLLLVSDGVRLVSIAGAKALSQPALLEDPQRRVLLARLLGAGIVAGTLLLGAVGMHRALGRPVVLRARIPLRRLPRALDGTTIVQLSDLHIGPTLGRDWVEDLVARVNALSPDLVAITGDLVDGSVPHLRDTVAPLAALRARYGVYFVTGNHEYYSGAEAWVRELSRLGIRVLRNERVRIGSEDASFDLAGVDDFRARGLARGHGADLPRALAGVDAQRELVLLAHQPKQVFEAARLGVGLQLSGHTHGGQIWPFRYLVRLQQPFLAGLERVENTFLYVSQGTGFWGPPMRVGTVSEISHITLESQPA